MMLILIFIFQCHVIHVISKDLPSFIHLCKRNDPELAKCLDKSIRDMEPYLQKGIPELELPPLDPFKFNNISAEVNGSSMKLNANLINGVVMGLSGVQILRANLDLDNAIYTVEANFPKLNLLTKYELKGKMLLFEIDGEGDAEFNATNIGVKVVHFGKFYEKDGARHVKYEKFDIKIDLNHEMSIYLHNLFTNNQILTDSVNQAVNDNMENLKEELDPLLLQTVLKIYADNFLIIYDLFSIAQLFPE